MAFELNSNKPNENFKDKKKTPKKSNFESYTDPTGELSASKLKYGLWLAKHEVLLYRLLIGALIIFCAITWVYSLIGWGKYLIVGLGQDQELYKNLSQFPNYQITQARRSPSPLQIISADVLPAGVNKSNALSEVINPNGRWLAKFNYHFELGGERTKTQAAFLLPSQDTWLVEFGIDGANLSQPNLVIENLSWSKISAHEVLDTASWQGARLNFVVSDFAFKRAGEDEDAPTAQTISFNLTNSSPFGYNQPKFIIGFYFNQVLVGVMPLELNNFASQQTANVDLRSFVGNLTVDEVKIFPLINIYDQQVYLAPPQ